MTRLFDADRRAQVKRTLDQSTGNTEQDDWNRRHEALAKSIWEEGAPMTPAQARQEATRQMREAGDIPPLLRVKR